MDDMRASGYGLSMPFPCGAPTLDPSGQPLGPPCRNMVREGRRVCGAGHSTSRGAQQPARPIPQELPNGPATFDVEDVLGHHLSNEEAAVRWQAAKIGVSLDATLSDAADDDDVAWSSNDWCLTKTDVIEAADIVVLRPGSEGDLQVLLIKRSHPPFASTWALPGGLRDPGESLQDTADRELHEETGLEAEGLTRAWLGEIVSTTWDPRFVGVNVGGRLVHAGPEATAMAGDDAVDAQWISLEAVSRGEYPLAFGHAAWLHRAGMADPGIAEQTVDRLEVLTNAGELRNRRLIRRVNEVRRQRCVELIPT